MVLLGIRDTVGSRGYFAEVKFAFLHFEEETDDSLEKSDGVFQLKYMLTLNKKTLIIRFASSLLLLR